MVDAVYPGDTIIVPNSTTKRHIEMLLHEKNKIKVEVKVIEVTRYREMTTGKRVSGSLYFDHTWLEEWYNFHLNAAEKELIYLSGVMTRGRPIMHVDTYIG